jgi:hypothetical protein
LSYPYPGFLDRGVLRKLLPLDLLLIAIHAGLGFAVMRGLVSHWPDVLNIGRDWSAGEVIGYGKWIVIIGVLLAAWRRLGQPILAGLAGFFLLCLLDDSLQIHEQGAPWLVDRFDLYAVFGTLQGTAAEVMVWGALGVFALGSLGIGWIRSGPEDRRRALPALGLFGLVAFFAIGMDVAHAFTDDHSLAGGIVGILEDGGEMIALTLLLAFVWKEYRAPAATQAASRRAASANS